MLRKLSSATSRALLRTARLRAARSIRRIERRDAVENAALRAAPVERPERPGAALERVPGAAAARLRAIAAAVASGDLRAALSSFVEAFLAECFERGEPICYGPSDEEFRPELGPNGALVLRGNWKPGVRDPFPELRAKWGADPELWPPAAACSTFVAAFLGYVLAARERFREGWGRQIKGALLDDAFLDDRVRWNLGRWRKWTFGKLERELAAGTVELGSPFLVLLWSSHVGILLDCDALDLVDPRTGRTMRGRWMLVADGSFRGAGKRRTYNGRTLVLEPISERVARNGDAKAFLLVPIVPPDLETIATAPTFVVERPSDRTHSHDEDLVA